MRHRLQGAVRVQHRAAGILEYVCLPVFSDHDGAPTQLFTIRQPVEDVVLRLPQLDPVYNPVGDDNRFVDVGAGVPDPAMLPVPLDPLML